MKKGDAVLTIEAMKMEIPVVAPEDGTVASINVAVGDAIEAGACISNIEIILHDYIYDWRLRNGIYNNNIRKPRASDGVF